MEIVVEDILPGDGTQTRTLAAEEGQTLLEALQAGHVLIQAPCGGAGTCGKCRVRLVQPDGGLKDVLACQTHVSPRMRVRLCPEAGALHVEGGDMGELAGLAGSLPDGIGSFSLDDAPEGALGMAVDVGTTTVAAYLFDLHAHRLIARDGCANPQASFGADVISRIHACSEGNLSALQQAVADCLRDLASRLCDRASEDVSRIVRWAIAGNTVMEHIACGLSPETIGVYPFEPQSRFGETRALPGCTDTAYLCPCVSGYVGGDITAGIVACGLDRFVAAPEPVGSFSAAAGSSPTVLFADLGTNGEMALIHDGKLICCATATGPAFEGASISQGMQARSGAIDGCRFERGAFACTSLDDAPPTGICGSGLIDALAACLQAGIVDETGRLLAPDDLPEPRRHLVELRDGKPVALLVPDGSVTLTQKDIRALQLAKAAVSAGISSLLRKAGVTANEVDEFVIGGAFGAHVKASSAAAIGLFPRVLAPRVRMVGNCAGAGACAALLSEEARERMRVVARSANYLELSLDQGFSEDYLEAMEFEAADE